MIDEPMVGLNPHHTHIMKDPLKERSLAGVTIFVSTHQLSVAEEMADRIGIIHAGWLVAVRMPEELHQKSGQSGQLGKTFLTLTAQEANLHAERQGK